MSVYGGTTVKSGRGPGSSATDEEGTIFSTDPKIAAGQRVGRQRGESIYGQTQEETGRGVQDILRRRKEQLEGVDPGADRLRRSRNERIRAAKARGASAGQVSQIERESASDIAATQYTRDQGALSAYQRLMGNILGGQTSLEMGFAGLEKAGERVAAPTQAGGLGGLFGTVVCTELYRQGRMTEEIYNKDIEYGKRIRITHPHIIIGYHFLAVPLVVFMKKSNLFTKLVSIPALAWARNMAGDKNLSGAVISLIGEAICGFVGKIKESNHAIKRRVPRIFNA